MSFKYFRGAVFFCIFYCTALFGDDRFSISDLLLPSDHELNKKLKRLCIDSDLFDSPDTLKNKGFHVYKRIHRGLMVMSHPTLRHYLIKKFKNTIPEERQIDNYVRRIQGAKLLREFIDTHRLKHITVPKKWLYRYRSYDRTFGYLLIVEKMNICRGGKDPQGETAKKYRAIDRSTLKELCRVLYRFRGLDSLITNLPFTRQNQIAFIDTEKWAEAREGFLSNIFPYLTENNRNFVEYFLSDLQKQNPFAGFDPALPHSF